MRDDLSRLPLPPQAKVYARRRGLASMQRQPQDFIDVMAAITGQRRLKKGFVNVDAAGKVPRAIKERAAMAVRMVLES